MAGLQRHLPKLSIENIRFKSDEALLVVQQAQQMAETWGADVVVTQNLKVELLSKSKEPILEIVRCPAVWKKRKFL